ncbi:helicase SKI2W-like [Patiria miniata]|uniref:Helicase SKI2W n=1 Tax=Patiria miniata TaxID=46514 RepID=A0A913Z519_PATMI|nr:helicase SKI2W-like [Patiria miniata]
MADDEWAELEKCRLDLTDKDSPDGLDFSLLELGSTGQVTAVPRSDPSTGPAPLSTLPNGLPPVLQDLKVKTLQFLDRPEKLPIHDVKAAQRFWPRKADPCSLYKVPSCPVQTTLQVERHPTTGELTGFREVQMEGTASTAKNSLSLRRQPGPPTQSVRGSSTNFPFWPGGIDEPSAETIHARGEDDEDIDFENDLLSMPPGLTNGMAFESKPTIVKTDTPDRSTPNETAPSKPASHILKLTDLMIIDDGDEYAFSDKEDDDSDEYDDGDASEVGGDSRKEADEVNKEAAESLDKMLPKEMMVTRQPKKEGAELTKEQWAVNVDISHPVSDFHRLVPAPAKEWPFQLDVFQKQAVIHLENHDCVFVAAHTSAGKTVVAEYAIALSLKHLTKTVYTSPIKALSNQKFRDFKETFGGDVGLLTGDVQIKTDSSCLIMTTEILRSMLYNGSDIIRDLEWVIFDEVHYINDSERGVVWEEVLIMLPAHVKIILLSATVPNTLEFADWVGRIKRKKIYVISTLKRPVPLEHFLYTGNSTKTNNELFLIVDSTKKFLTSGYHKAVDAKKERESKASSSHGAKGPRQWPHKGDKGVYLSIIEMLRKREQLPVVAFTFSKKRCDENATMLTTLDLTTTNEKSEIHVFMQKCVERLKGTDRMLPQVLHMRDLLKRGIAVHHSGILPILKEMIEMLFQRGLVKLLFATETFAMGVNMPARTVIFDSIRKFDGTGQRTLLAGEYVQMAGRAGRRGLDTTGMVIILCKGDVPESAELHKMMLGKPTQLESQFRLTYTMILNLLCVEELRVEDMMKRSFSESSTRKDAKEYEAKLRVIQEEMSNVQTLNCYLCHEDLDQYYQTCKQLQGLRLELRKMIASHPLGVKALSPGRVVIVSTKEHRNALGVVLSSSTASKERTFKTLVLTNHADPGGAGMQNGTADPGGGHRVHVQPLRKEPLFRPEGPCGHTVLDLVGQEIGTVTTVAIKIASDRIAEDFKKRQIPRFRDNPPSQSTSLATQELLRITEANPEGLTSLDPVKDLHLRELDQVEKFQERDTLESLLDQFGCLNCPNFLEHFGVMCHRMKLKEDFNHLRFLLSDQSLHLLPEYHQRIQVLRHLRHIDGANTIQLKGRVARVISNHELIITELVFQGLLTGLPPEEIAALLSCMVFQEKRCSEPELTPSLKEGVGKIKAEAKRLAEIQHECGINLSVQDYVEQFRFGLTQVVYEWARGMPFADITNLTDVSEGIIVRTIQRLDEVCRDVRSAARIVGDPSLFQKMDEASQLIKRDIVFAASLYTQ